MDKEKRKRGRPPKDPTGLRKTKISTYVSDEVADVLRAEAEARGMTISELVATVLEGRVYGAKNDIRLPPVPRDAIYAVIKTLVDEGLLLGANVSPKTINSAEFAPKTSPATSTGAKAEKQQGDDDSTKLSSKTKRRATDRGKGGDSDDT